MTTQWNRLLKTIRDAQVDGKRSKIIQPLRNFVKKYPVHFDAQVELASALYHTVYDDMTRSGRSFSEVKKDPSKYRQVAKAIKICEQIIQNVDEANQRALKNARMMLAQIFSLLGDPKGLEMSKKNYDDYRDPLFLERYATNCFYFNKWNDAIKILHRYLSNARKNKESLTPGYEKLVVAYSNVGDNQKAFEYYNKLKNQLPRDFPNKKVQRAILTGLGKILKGHRH